MICKFCNASIIDNARFCTHCGRKLDAVQPPVRQVIKCANQLHFYDSAMYGTCPHCAAMNVNSNVNMAAPANTPSVNAAVAYDDKTDKRPLFGFVKKSSQEMPQRGASDGSADKKIPKKARPSVKQDSNSIAAKNETPPMPPSLDSVDNSLIKNEYNNRKKPYTPRATDSSKTVAIYSNLGTDELAVGWLICVKGENFGTVFDLKAGKNRIGRSPSMDVSLLQEESVSRNVHAVIIFEHRKCRFILQPGDESGLTYLNEELVLEHQILEPYDKIMLGECELIFVPLCGERFTWDSYKSET